MNTVLQAVPLFLLSLLHLDRSTFLPLLTYLYVVVVDNVDFFNRFRLHLRIYNIVTSPTYLELSHAFTTTSQVTTRNHNLYYTADFTLLAIASVRSSLVLLSK
jgi:hypothetical protein